VDPELQARTIFQSLEKLQVIFRNVGYTVDIYMMSTTKNKIHINTKTPLNPQTFCYSEQFLRNTQTKENYWTRL